MRATHWTNGLLLALLLLGSLWAWPHLPERIPAHFGPGGEITRWTQTSLGSWLSLPLLAVAVVALNYLLAQLLPRWPRLVNLPDKEKFLTLPPERRARVIARVQELLYGLSSPLIVLFGFIQWMTYRTAQGVDSRPYTVVVLLVSLLMTPMILIVWLPRIQREMSRQVREHRAEGG